MKRLALLLAWLPGIAAAAAYQGLTVEQATELARAAALRWLEGKQIAKTIHVPDRLVSFVVKG